MLPEIKWSFVSTIELLLCARRSTEHGPLVPVSLPTTSSCLEAGWAPLCNTHFLQAVNRGDFPEPSISKPFPKRDPASCFQREPWQIIKKEEHEVGLLWVGKPKMYLSLFQPAHALVLMGFPNAPPVTPPLSIQWKERICLQADYVSSLKVSEFGK